ncbi:hypothetical protein GCM10008110_18360 [Marinobacter persicus]|nr:hypothetical protein GCM10008110_18360 [Marinobacter persicus]
MEPNRKVKFPVKQAGLVHQVLFLQEVVIVHETVELGRELAEATWVFIQVVMVMVLILG